jgi:retinol dehydrogenase-12
MLYEEHLFVSHQIVKSSKLAQDVGIAKKLWEVSETIVKLEPLEKYF